ncbi:hypothetical protein LI031_19750 [Enterocloster citroniae]|uniref:hypothetical protein n=1 Tax=Enterocloster citroniae TaxID=358743 RepID=UPI001D0844F7|nr:hypothetical protein [Enterocloster citroniae]MCB7066089.1 hypothetical protein [Enterocloster citroniae]
MAGRVQEYAKSLAKERQKETSDKIQVDHSMEKTDFFRADREQAARDYAKQNAKQRLSRFQPDFYGNLTPNTYLDSASSEELSALGKAERNRGKLADMAEEYARIRTNRTSNTVISSNLDTASSADLSAWAKQAKETNKKAYQNQKAMDQIGFRDEAGAFHRYDSLERQEPDFTEMVGAGKERDNIFDPTASYGPLDYLNKDKRAVIQGSQYNFTKMTDTEKNLYYYLNGKYGPQAAANYIKTLGPELNWRNVEDVQESASSLAKEHPVLGVGLDAGIAMAGSGAYPVLLAEQAYNNMMGRHNDMDPNDPMFGSSILSEGIRTGITNDETLSKMIPNEGLRNFLVGTGLSMTENIARLPLGHYGLAAAAGGAGLSGTREAVQRGGDNAQAITLGVANAAAEAFFEKFSLEGLEAMKVAPGKGVREFLKNVGKQAVTEGSEEVFTEIANSISDQAIMGELSQYHLAYENYRAQGMDEKTAKQQAFLDFVKNVGEAGLGGALSGGVMGAGSQALGKMQESSALNQYGKSLDIDYRDYAQGLDTTLESYVDPADYQEATELQKIAQEYATKQANKEFIPNRDKAEYDLRAQQFVENTVQHNEEKNVRETNQNDQQMEEKQQAEQTYAEATKAEYEPYNEPETRQSYMPNTVEKEAEPAYTQGQPAPQTETTKEIIYTNTETSPQNQTKAYRKPYGKNGQTALMEGYDGSIELSAYNKAFGRVYDAGYYNVDMNIAERSAILSVLGNDQFLAAYKAGAQDYNLESKAQRINMVQGAPKTGGLGTVAESAAVEQRKVAEHIGKMTGLKINLVDGMEQSGTVGSYKNGEITLSVNSNDFNGSLTHELTHHIKEYSPKGYRMYTEIAVEALMKSENISLENLVERYTNQYADAGQELTREEVMEEIVADATQKFFNDSEFIASVIKKDKTVAQRVMDFLSDVIDSIKQLMKNGSTRAAAKGLEEDLRYYEDARDAWMHALEDAGETYKSGMESRKKGQKERNALEKPDQVTEKNIKENYGKVREMESVTEMEGTEFGKGEKKLSEQILEFFESIGGKAHNEVVGDVILNKRAIKDDMAHGISRKKAVAFAAIPDVIEKGYVLDHQKNWKGRGYDSAAIGAKVKLAGEEYYELVIVKLKNENHLYVHEVHTAKVGEDSVQDQLFPSAESSNGTSGGNPLPIYSIFDKLINVNGEAKDNQSENIRFQLEDVDDTVTDRRIEALLYENQTLRDANALLERQFELTPKSAVRQQDIEKVAKGLLKEYSSTYKPDTLTKNLDKLYEYIRSAEHVDGAAVTEAATSIAKSVLKQSSKIDTELMDQYKDLRKQIRNTKITISDQDKADLAATGGYNEFRKRNFGRMKLGSDGISIDSLYQELNVQYPELFPSSMTHPADQLMAIESALDMTGEQISNPYSANLDEMSYIVSQEIMQSYFDVRKEIPTFADKKAAEVDRVKREYSRKMADYKDKLKQEYKETKKTIYRENMKKIDEMKNTYNNLSQEKQREMKDYYMQKMNDLRNEKNWKLAAMQTKNREQVKKIYDSRRAREAKKSIMKEAKTLQGWLLKPTDAKHIPEGLRTTVAEFLGNIDFSANEENNSGIPTQRTQEWEKVKNEFDKIVKDGGMVEMDDGSYAYMEIDPDMIAKIEGIVKKVEGIDKLDNLDPYSLEEIKEVVVSMKKAITQINNLKSNKKYGQLSILADDMFSDLEKRRTKMEYTGVIGKPDKLLNYDMLDPQTMFEQIGPAAKTMYDALRTGLNQKTLKLKSAQDYIEKAMSEANITVKDIREWSGNGAKTERFKVAGGEIELTIADIMSLYELNKRPAARGHIYDRNGGIKPHQRKAGISLKNGKLTPSHVEKSVRAVRVTESDVKMITDTLTQEQKKLADAIQAFMGNEVAEWGNEVTMELYGYNKFTAGQYYPIVVDKSNVPTKEGEINQTGTIRNMGITKSTREHAHNPIIIEDIFDVYSRQVDQMSSYHAYVIPLLDLQRVYNYIDLRNGQGSIKEQIDRTFGKAGNDYIHKLLVDINGSVNAETGFINGMLSNMKAASVAGNLRVAIQQPTAYLRASMEISPKYLALGAKTMTRKGQWDLICKYAPIAQWKDWGFYRMDTSRQMKDIMFGTDSRKQRFVNKTMVLAEAGDKLAWNRLWRACEYECMDKHPELKQGSEEFYQQVGARFSEIVDKTQVVDSVLHRTQIMRSQDTGTKIATSFMAEPLKTYDMLYRAVMDVKNGKDKSKQRAARAAAVFVATNVATALAAAVVDAARDDDRDKDYKEKYKEASWNNFVDGMNIINNIPYAKDVVSAFSGYSATRADTAAYQDLYYAFKKLGKVYSGDSSLTPQYVALYTAEMSSKLLGIPIRSISRDVQAIADTAVHEFGSETADYKWLKQKYALGSKENLNLYVGMMVEAQRNGDKELQKRIKTDLNKAEIDNETITAKIKSLIKGELISKDHVDPRIEEAAQARMAADTESYKAAVGELIAEGYAGKLVNSAVDARINQLSGEEEIDWEEEAATDPDELYGEILTGEEEEEGWDIYSSGDILKAVDQVEGTMESTKAFKKIAAEIIDSKVKAGKTKKEALVSIKSPITCRYKQEWIAAYLAGDQKGYEAIQAKLNRLILEGKNLYTGEDYIKWRKEAKDKEKEEKKKHE